STRPVRAVADDIDRSHPLVVDRSIKVELGGAVAVASPRMEKIQMLRVAGPRRAAVGPIPRHRASLPVFLVRAAPGRGPAGGRGAGRGRGLLGGGRRPSGGAGGGRGGRRGGRSGGIARRSASPGYARRRGGPRRWAATTRARSRSRGARSIAPTRCGARAGC